MTGKPEQEQPMYQAQPQFPAASPPPAAGTSYPPPVGPSPSKWFGPEWQEAQVKALKGSVKHLIVGLVMFVLAMGFIVFAAVANNFDQVKALFGM